jgi:hypothetical protein
MSYLSFRDNGQATWHCELHYGLKIELITW